MNKKGNLIIWIISIILVITAASVIYSKYKPKEGSVKLSGEKTTETSMVEPDVETAENNTSDQTAGKTQAPDFTLNDMDGKVIKLSDCRGKIVIINFWAVWCKYCVQEMPDLNELNKELEKEKDVIILAIDSQESKATVKEYLDSNNISLKVLLDSDGAITQNYGITGFPTTFVVNREGVLFTYISGATNKETLRDIIKKVK
jgi:peroxiredoxin